MDIETIALMIADMGNAQQKEFYKALAQNGLSAEDIQTIQRNVFYTKLFTDESFYKAAMAETMKAVV